MVVVWMLPGQGAQFHGMGRALMERGGAFEHWMHRLDRVAADYLGHSLVDLIYDPARRALPMDDLLDSHPALFMVEYATAQALLEAGFPEPDRILGASLGEFVAAALAGRIAPEDALFDLIKQARLFVDQCAGGAMLAVIDDPASFPDNPVFAGRCEMAGANMDRCFVVAGRDRDIAGVQEDLNRAGVATQRLPVPVAFHSSLVDGAEDLFRRLFGTRVYAPPRIPLLSSAEGAGTRPASTVEEWWRVVRAPIAFRDTLLQIARDHGDEAVFLDIGPAGNLAGFVRYLLPGEARKARILSVMSPFSGGAVDLPGLRDRLLALRDPTSVVPS